MYISNIFFCRKYLIIDHSQTGYSNLLLKLYIFSGNLNQNILNNFGMDGLMKMNKSSNIKQNIVRARRSNLAIPKVIKVLIHKQIKIFP